MSESILKRPVPPADARLRYGPEPSQFGELWRPAGEGPHPCVLVLHGGFWRARYDLGYAGHLCRALAAAGIAAWNLEYRRVGEAGGGWPGTFRDVARGAGYLFEFAPRYGIDRARVAVLGHSAGGHLALWVVGRRSDAPGGSGLGRGEPPPPFRGAVSLAGVADLRLAWDLGLSEHAVGGLLGGSPGEVPGRYAAASPRALLPLGVRQTLIHGAEDANVPVTMSEEYHAAAVAAGDEADLVVLPGVGHFEPVDPESTAWPAVLGAVRALVET